MSLKQSNIFKVYTRLKILLISRKFPPSVGGMQRLSYQLVTHLRAYADVHAITWGGSQRWLPWFLLRALVQGWRLARDVDVLHAGDPLVAPVVALLAALHRKPSVVNVHGLDLTFNFPGYQALMRRLLRRFTRVVCISQMAYEEALRRGLAAERCRIIHPGLDLPIALPEREATRAAIAARFGVTLAGRQVWLTVGRLVPRKGVVWFCDEVLPRLRDSAGWLYLVAGEGPEERRLRAVIGTRGLAGRVILLGRVSDTELTQLYTAADAFIMPNIPQPHDREGFGLVAIESAAHGTPVIAARLEGVQDAVIEGESGYFLPAQDAEAWVTFLRQCVSCPHLLEDLRLRAQRVVVERFIWDKIIARYLEVFREAVNEAHQNRNGGR